MSYWTKKLSNKIYPRFWTMGSRLPTLWWLCDSTSKCEVRFRMLTKENSLFTTALQAEFFQSSSIPSFLPKEQLPCTYALQIPNTRNLVFNYEVKYHSKIAGLVVAFCNAMNIRGPDIKCLMCCHDIFWNFILCHF